MTSKGNVTIGERKLEQVLLLIFEKRGIEKMEGSLSEGFSYGECFEDHL
jgi:hypothetical protein